MITASSLTTEEVSFLGYKSRRSFGVFFWSLLYLEVLLWIEYLYRVFIIMKKHLYFKTTPTRSKQTKNFSNSVGADLLNYCETSSPFILITTQHASTHLNFLLQLQFRSCSNRGQQKTETLSWQWKCFQLARSVWIIILKRNVQSFHSAVVEESLRVWNVSESPINLNRLF